MSEPEQDQRIRLAAVEHVKQPGLSGSFSSEQLYAGFTVDGARIPLTNPQRGIFKPTQMRYLLSVKTVFPARGRKVWYDDQREVHEQITRGSELIDYAFMGDAPQAADNRWLREARHEQIPILYFLGLAPQRWIPIWPTYIAEWSATELKARLAFGVPAQVSIDDANLIGIDPDYRIHTSESLLSMNDGPMFEQGLKALAGGELRRPKRHADRPDPDRLALRFASFRG